MSNVQNKYTFLILRIQSSKQSDFRCLSMNSSREGPSKASQRYERSEFRIYTEGKGGVIYSNPEKRRQQWEASISQAFVLMHRTVAWDTASAERWQSRRMREPTKPYITHLEGDKRVTQEGRTTFPRKDAEKNKQPQS